MVYLFISMVFGIAATIAVLLNNVYAENWRTANADWVKQYKDEFGQDKTLAPAGNQFRSNVFVITFWIAVVNFIIAGCICIFR